MKIFVMYDIKENKIRNRLINKLFDFGFERIQYSLFLGNINWDNFFKLVKNIEEIDENNENLIYMIPLGEKEYQQTIFLGKNFDTKYIGKKISFF